MTEHDERLAAIENELKRLRSDPPTDPKLQDIRSELRDLRDQVVELKGAVRASAKPEVDLGPLESRLDSMNTEVREVNKKTLPLTSYIAAFGIILAVLGWSYLDLRKISEPIKVAATNVDDAAAALIDTTDNLRSASQQFQDNQEFLSSSVGQLTESIQGSLETLTEFDKVLAQVLAEVSRIKTSTESFEAQRSGFEVEGDARDTLSVLLGALGDDLPAEMRLLRDARSALEMREYSRARELAAQARDIDTDESEAVYDFLIARSFNEEGRPREALGAYQNVLAKEPENEAAYNNIGSIYYKMAEDETEPETREELLNNSVAALRKAMEIVPDDPTVRTNLSVTLNELERYDESLDTLREYEGPDSAELLRQEAATLALLGRKAAAIEALSRAIDIDESAALWAAADMDFRELHGDESFERLLETHLGSDLMQSIRRAWQDYEED